MPVERATIRTASAEVRAARLALSSPSLTSEVAEAIREALNIGLRYAKANMLEAPVHSCGPESACDNDCAAYAYQAGAIAKIEAALRTLSLGSSEG